MKKKNILALLLLSSTALGLSACKINLNQIAGKDSGTTSTTSGGGGQTPVVRNLDKPVIEYDDDSVSIWWKSVKNATGYNVYCEGELILEQTPSREIDIKVTLNGKKNSEGKYFTELKKVLEFKVEAVYVNETKVVKSEKSDAALCDYYVETEKTSFTVTFVSNCDTSIAKSTVNKNDPVAEPGVTLVKEHFTFDGWFLDNDTEYDFATPVTDDLSLYAKWTIASYTVTFNTNGGSTIASQEVKHGDRIDDSILTAPIKEDAIFDGWYLDQALKNPVNFATTYITEPTIIYAKWNEIITNKLATPVTNLIGSVVTWADVTGASIYNVYLDGELVNTQENTAYSLTYKKVDQVVTVVAVDLTGAKENSNPSSPVVLEGIDLETPVIYDNNGIISWNPIEGAEGYYVFVDGLNVSDDGQAETTYDATGLSFGNHSVIVKAFFDIVQSAPSNELIVVSLYPDSPTRFAYDKNTIASPDWDISHNHRDIGIGEGFDMRSGTNNGGVDSYIEQARNITTNTPTLEITARTFTKDGIDGSLRPGETFGTLRVYVGGVLVNPVSAYNRDLKVDVPVSGSPLIQSDNLITYTYDLNSYFNTQKSIKILNENGSHIILTAVEFVKNYTVSFNSNGGSNVNPIIGQNGKVIAAPTKPTKAGYTFGGWYKESELINKWDFTNDVVSGDMTLYAAWTTPSALKAPTLTLLDKTVSWTAVSGADHYIVYNNSVMVEDNYKQTSYELAARSTDQSIVVVAVSATNEKSLPSDPVILETVKLAAPVVTIGPDLVAKWNSVANAEIYNVYIGDRFITSVEDTSYQLSPGATGNLIYIESVDSDMVYGSNKSVGFDLKADNPSITEYNAGNIVGAWTVDNSAGGGACSEGFDLQSAGNFGGKDAYISQDRVITANTRTLNVSARCYYRPGETYGKLRVYVNNTEIQPIGTSAPTINFDDPTVYSYNLASYFNQKVTIKIENNGGTHVVLTSVNYSSSYTPTLSVPVLTLNENTLSWTAVDHANSYEVYKDGVKIATVSTTTYALSAPLGKQYYIIAKDTNGVYADARSNSVSPILDNPETLAYTKVNMENGDWDTTNAKVDKGVGEGYDLLSGSNNGGNASSIAQNRTVTANTKTLSVSARCFKRQGETYGTLKVYVNGALINPTTGTAPVIGEDVVVTTNYDLSAYLGQTINVKIENDGGTHMVFTLIEFN